MKYIQYIFTIAAMLFFAQSIYAQTSDPDPVVTEKTATPNGDGTYTLTLKSYVTGQLVPKDKMLPADIIFTMDLSGSMKKDIGKDDVYTEVIKAISGATKAVTEATKAMTATTSDKAVATEKNPSQVTKAMTATDRVVAKTQNWTYKNTTANTAGTANYSHYYRDDAGNYYVVHKAKNLANSSSGSENVRALWYVDNNGVTWYLTSEGVSSTYKDVTSDTATIWNGTLYTGWTYNTHGNSTDGYDCYGFSNCNETATLEKQWYYLYTDGEYYPVRKAANLPDSNGGNTARAAWIEVNGVKWYLHGDHLDTDYDRDMMGDYRSIWFGVPLYKGGWQYSTIKAATDENGHYYLHTDGKYYPVQKAQETVGGVNTYQAFVEIPSVGKRYLFGTGLSETPCPYATSNAIYYYFGALYTGGWCYNSITDGTTGTKHYYKYTDGEYYPVRKETSTNNFQAYIETPDGKFYLDGNGLSTVPYSLSTTKYVTLYFGTLYTMTGWTSAAIIAATAEGGHFYKHTDDKYYPVLKETLTSPTTTYQAYVMLAGSDGNLTVKKYLWGHGLHDEPCPYSAATKTVFYYGTLYTGGWRYSTVTVATSDAGGHTYLHTDGEYYPVNKETVSVTVDGVSKTTYQVYVELPASEGGKMYLWGDGVHSDPYPYSWAQKASMYFGPLYSGGWSYDHIGAPTAANGHFYKHSDGKYYRVVKEKMTSPMLYQLYVELPEGKRYLYGSTISVDPYPYAIQPDMGIYYGTLYTGGWTYAGITAGSATGGHYYLYEGEYYPVHKKKETYTYDGTSTATWQAFVELPDAPDSETMVKWYLTPAGLSTTEYKWSRNSDGKSTVWLESLYLLKQYNYTRYEGLRRAVTAFVDDLSERCVEEGVHTRVALTQYATHGWAYSPYNSNTQANLNKPHLKQFTNADADGNSAVLCDFKDLTDPVQVQAIKDALPEGTPTTGGTSARWGFSLARGLFEREGGDESDKDGNGTVDTYEQTLYTDADYAGRMKILISIGDGEDYDSGSLDRSLWLNYTNNVFKPAMRELYGETVKIFVVHVQTTPISDAEKQIASPDEIRDDGSVFHYYYDVKHYDESLIEALLSIASQAGGAAVDLGSDAIVQDVVRDEFTVPTNATVSMFTANCIGENTDGLIFEDEADWAAFSGSYTRTNNPDGTTTIRVTGFDFSANWCGDHGEEEGYMGKQLIIRFPIVPNDELVGGMIPTNTSDSKIIDGDGNSVEPFPIPEVGPFPLHIQIEKSGLLPGHSAVFNIWRKAKTAASFDTTGTPFMRVAVTGSDDGTPVTADITNLDPDYDYLIQESTWSWRYTPTVNSISTLDQTSNPFSFGNTLESGGPKSGEAMVKNEFF